MSENRDHGYTARWHLLNGLPVPTGPALDYVLSALEPSLGALSGGMEFNEDSDKPSPVVSDPAPIIKVFKEVEHTTPNKGGSMKPLGIVFHSSYGSAAGSLSWIKDPASKVSYHTMIFPDGTRHNVVPFDRVAWHAGQSSFRGKSGCNGFTVGISWEGDLYKRQLSENEIASAVEISVRLMKKYGFGLEWVTDHRTVSPGRKADIPPAVLAMIKSRIEAVL
jgi:N-acetyl-anhydromuramyl-L-alanine amidase AmpD